MSMDRRQFLQDTAALAASISAIQATTAPARAADESSPRSGKKVGPNDVINVAVIGVRGRGMEHVRSYNELDESRITTICDVDRNVISKAMKAVTTANGSEP